MVDHVCKTCIVTSQGFDTWADLTLLHMLDFHVILGMNWLALYHVVLDCYAIIVTLAIPGISPVIWQGFVSRAPTRIISYI